MARFHHHFGSFSTDCFDQFVHVYFAFQGVFSHGLRWPVAPIFFSAEIARAPRRPPRLRRRRTHTLLPPCSSATCRRRRSPRPRGPTPPGGAARGPVPHPGGAHAAAEPHGARAGAGRHESPESLRGEAVPDIEAAVTVARGRRVLAGGAGAHGVGAGAARVAQPAHGRRVRHRGRPVRGRAHGCPQARPRGRGARPAHAVHVAPQRRPVAALRSSEGERAGRRLLSSEVSVILKHSAL